MPFKPGDPKPEGSGRKPGVRNKAAVIKVDEVLAKNRKHPVEEILLLIPELKPHEAVKAWLELLSYMQSKPKDIVDGKSVPRDLEPLEEPTDVLLFEYEKKSKE